MIDLRSDTLTQPTASMRQCMAAAEVGDDVFGEDPTVRRLEERIAGMLGMEAAVLMPSGTMTNQVGLRVHCQAGDQFFAEDNCHILCYEQGAYAQLFGLVPAPIAAPNNVLTVELLEDRWHKEDVHFPRPRLVCLENTHNRGGGRVLPLESVEAVCQWAADRGLARHLDGARLFNAVVASGISADRWAACFDTVSICFSKGLGAPVGSALCGSGELIHRARRHRKALGGGMRQAGVLAAAALYALEHHVDRLAKDHAHAQTLAAAISKIEGLTLDPPDVDTNIVYFRVTPKLGTAAEFCQRLSERGVQLLPLDRQRVRAVTHLDVDGADIDQACDALAEVANRLG